MATTTQGAKEDFNIDDLFQHRGPDRPDVVRPPDPEDHDHDHDEEDDDDEEEAIDGEVIDVGDGEEVAEEPLPPKPKVQKETSGTTAPTPSKPPAPEAPEAPEPGALGDENIPPEDGAAMQETNSTTSRPSRLSRLSSKLSGASTLSTKLKSMLRTSLSRSRSSMSHGLVGKERVVRKYQFSTNGIMHFIDVSHSQEVFYLILDSKLIAKKQHGKQTFASEVYELEFLVPSGTSDRNVAYPGKLTVKWRVAAGKWRYEMTVAGKTVPCMWKYGRETGKEVLIFDDSDQNVETKRVPDGATAPRPEHGAETNAQEASADDERLDEAERRRADDLALLNNKAQPARREPAARETDQKEPKHISMTAPADVGDNERAKADLALLNRFAPQPRAQHVSM